MAHLKEVKTRIVSVNSTQQITKAMKMVAASKLRKAQDRIHYMRLYTEKFESILNHITSAQDENVTNWYNPRDKKKILLLVISSDRGLCGSFNNYTFKSTLHHIDEKYADQHQQGHVTILPLGKKAYEYFNKRNYPIIKDYWDIFHDLHFEKTSALCKTIIQAYHNGTYDKVDIIYNQFKNVATQVLQIESYLPITPHQSSPSAVHPSTHYIYQPHLDDILTEIIPKSLHIQLYKALLESNASENGARMTAMDQATENASELLKDLKLMYNRSRQAAITTEILEIVAGAEALKNG